MGKKLRQENNKRAVIFWPYPAFPPFTGTHQVQLGDLNALQKLGYEVTLFSADLFADSSGASWQVDRINEMKKRIGVKIRLYQGGIVDRLFMRRRSITNPESWDQNYPPWFLEGFRQLFYDFMPDLILVHYPSWGKIAIGDELNSATRIIRCHDLLALNERMIRKLTNDLPIPADPGKIAPDILDESYFWRDQLDRTKMMNDEYWIYDQYDSTVTLSAQDAKTIQGNTHQTLVQHVPPVYAPTELNNTYGEAPLLVISNYILNIQGYLYFAKKVLSHILRRAPDFTLQVAGKACENIGPVKGVRFLGYVPDLKHLYLTSGFTICPVIGGTGIQIKILESMAHGLPVVALKNIAKSSPIQHGINGLIAENAEEFAEYTIQLSLDRGLCRRLGQEARKTIEEQFSPKVQVERWAKAIKATEECQGKRKDRHGTEVTIQLSRSEMSQTPYQEGVRVANPRPKISIITPTRNCATYIRTCIESLLEQNYENFEHIVVDGQSTDNTVEILKEYPHLKWISEPDHGEAEALNKALKMVTGEIICWLNADDWCANGTFERVVQELNPQQDRYIIYGNTNMVDENGKLLWVKRSAPNMTLGFLVRWWRCPAHPHQPSIFFSRKVIEEVGPFNPELNYSIDLEYWLRAILKFPFCYVDQTFANARIRCNSKSIDTEPEQIQSHWKVTLPYHPYLSPSEKIHFWEEYFLHRLYERRDPELTRKPDHLEAFLGLSRALLITNHFEKTFFSLYPTKEEQRQVIRGVKKVLEGQTELDSHKGIKELWQKLSHEISKSTSQKPTIPSILWKAPAFDPSGYANHSRNLIRHLSESCSIRLQPITQPSEKFLLQLDAKEREALARLTQTPLGDSYLQLIHAPAYAFQRDPYAIYNIGRTVFETDRLPPDWISRCNTMDEIWVPTQFNLMTFKKSGVTVPIYVVPEGVDPDLFRPGLSPFLIPDRRKFAFLSIFEWTYRKGWDILLKAWAEAFKPDEEVCLVIKTYPLQSSQGVHVHSEIEARIHHFLHHVLGRSSEDVAPLIILSEQLSEAEMPHLYASANAYVMPSRGEGWGRPYIEAMATGLPVIGTRWSGNLEFMTEENSYLLEIEGLTEVGEEEEIPFLRGHRWAVPSLHHLIELMRFLYKHPEEGQRKGRQARQDVIEKWSWKRAASQALKRLEEIQRSLPKRNRGKEFGEIQGGRVDFPDHKTNDQNSNRFFYLVRYAGMGDVLMAFPLTRALKHVYPQGRVAFVTDKKYKGLVEANPYVDEVIPLDNPFSSDLRRRIDRRPAEVFDLNPAKFGIGEMHQVDAFLNEVRLTVPDTFKEIVLNIPESVMDRVDRLLEEKGNGLSPPFKGGKSKLVILHAAKNDPNRTWPAGYWNRLAQMILNEGYRVLATGDNIRDSKRGVNPIPTEGVINLVDQLNPLEFVALCRRANLLITTDSGTVQLAGASDIAIAGIYTVIPGRCRLPYRYGRLMWNTVSIEPECEYSGCYLWTKEEKYFSPWKEKIEKGEISPMDLFATWCIAKEKYACLHHQITPEGVWQKAKALLLQEANLLNELGESLFCEGKVEEAEGLFKKVLEREAHHFCTLNNLGVIAFQRGEIDEAISFFTRSVEINGHYFEAIDHLGRCMMAKQLYQEAIHWFGQALDLRPDDVDLLNAFASCFIQTKDFHRAEEIYQRSFQLNHHQPHVKEILGELGKLKAIETQRRVTP